MSSAFVALAAAAMVLPAAGAAPATAGGDPVLATRAVSPGGFVRLEGNGLAALRETHDVLIGGRAVARKLIREWSETAIEFQAQVDPGEHGISLSPTPTLPDASLHVGTVHIGKAVVPGEASSVVEGSIQVRLAPGVDAAAVLKPGDSAFRNMVNEPPTSRLGRWYTVGVPSGSERDRIEAYADDPRVEIAEATTLLQPGRTPNDPCVEAVTTCGGSQWNVRNTRLTAAWEAFTSGVSIAVLDTGVSTSHQDVNVGGTPKDMTGNNNPAPCSSHGTTTASIAGGRANNGVGVAGAAWAASIGSYKIGRGPGCPSSVAWTAAAILEAAADGYKVINISYWGQQYSDQVRDAVDTAWNTYGVNLVSIAGNDGTNTIEYPGAYENVIDVAASDAADNRAAFSNYGYWIDITAPGVSIPGATAASSSSYGVFDGTSSAAPLVAGTVALLRASGLNHVDARARLLTTCDPLGWSGGGCGRMNAYRALVPARDCIRDIPGGAWVRRNSGEVYQSLGGNVLRFVPDIKVYVSWLGVDADKVPLCEARFAETTVHPTSIGYRPGSLVRDPANGWVWLITSDGADRGLPVKRLVASADVFTCFGWQWANVRDGLGTSLGLHSAGPTISTCNPMLPRAFPSGTLVRAPGGTISMVEDGTRRPIASWGAYTSWFGSTEWVAASSTELDLIPMGAGWGYRPGKQFQPTGSADIFIVSDDGERRAAGSRRRWADALSWTERSYDAAPFDAGVTSDVLALHNVGPPVRNANVNYW